MVVQQNGQRWLTFMWFWDEFYFSCTSIVYYSRLITNKDVKCLERWQDFVMEKVMKSALWTRDHNSAYGCVLFGPHIAIKIVNHHSKKIRKFPIEVHISASFQTSDALAILRYVFFPMSICRTQWWQLFWEGSCTLRFMAVYLLLHDTHLYYQSGPCII